MKKNLITLLTGILILSVILAACSPQTAPTVVPAAEDSSSAVTDLAAVKAYAVDQASRMKEATTAWIM